MKEYKHIYFDLDRTLWDFESNSKDTFQDIIEKYELMPKIGSFARFMASYRKFNERLWRMYREKQIEKKVLSWKRFYLTLNEFGINDIELAKKIGCHTGNLGSQPPHALVRDDCGPYRVN